MNYYPHHIGDFNSATRHLTRIERSVYRDLIELYYDTELPLTLDLKALCRKVLAKEEEESTAVEQVLNEFFTQTEQGWQHERCDREIYKYQGLVEARSVAGRASAAKRANKVQSTEHTLDVNSTDVEQVLNECATNQEPRTKNQEPRTINQSTKNKPSRTFSANIFPEIPDRQLVNDWITVRNKKKAPVTHTALEGFMREVDKSGMTLDSVLRQCCEHNWAGFKAEWMTKGNVNGNTHNAKELANKESTARARTKLFGQTNQHFEKDITHETTRL